MTNPASAAEAPAPAAPAQLVIRLVQPDEEEDDRKHGCNHPEHNIRYMPQYLFRVIESKDSWTWIDIRMIEVVKRQPDGSGQVFINGQPHGFDKETFAAVEREWINYVHGQDGSWGYSEQMPAGVKMMTRYKFYDMTTKQYGNPYGAARC